MTQEERLLVKNGEDEEQVRRGRSKQKQRDLRDEDDLRYILYLEKGRRFIWRILSQANVFALSYTGEVNSTMHHEGMRRVGIALLQWIEGVNPEVVGQMMKEAREDRIA